METTHAKFALRRRVVIIAIVYAGISVRSSRIQELAYSLSTHACAESATSWKKLNSARPSALDRDKSSFSPCPKIA